MIPTNPPTSFTDYRPRDTSAHRFCAIDAQDLLRDAFDLRVTVQVQCACDRRIVMGELVHNLMLV